MSETKKQTEKIATSNLCLPKTFNQETKDSINAIFFGDEMSLYPSISKAFSDFGISNVEGYIGFTLGVRMLREELFELNKVRPGIEKIILELQKNTVAGADKNIMYHLIIKVGVFELIKTLSIYRGVKPSK